MIYLDNLPVSFLFALESWASNNFSRLEKIIKNKPAFLKELPKGKSAYLWRGITITRKQYEQITKGGVLTPKQLLESWTDSKTVAKKFAVAKKGMVGILVKKKIPNDKRIVCFPELKFSEPIYKYFVKLNEFASFQKREKETICYAVSINKSDIEEVFQ